MKTTKLLIAVLILIRFATFGQTITGIYLSSSYLPSEDGEFVQVNFKDNNGKQMEFIEEAGAFMGNNEKANMFTAKAGNANNITNKANAGKKYNITYYINGNGVNIITSATEQKDIQTKNPGDSTFHMQKKIQDELSIKNKCPNCAPDGAKQFLKTFIVKLGGDKQSVETKAFLELAITENKFITYYFSNKRSSVVISKKFKNRYFAIQLKKENNKWVGIGIDDQWTSCKGEKPEDKVSQQEAIDCTMYIDRILKK